MDGLVIHQTANSAGIRSTVPRWRVCKDNPDGTRPPVTEERFEDPEEAEAWIRKTFPTGS